MNIRNVLKTYSLLRTLSDDESALLTTLRSMNDTERELLVESLSPTKGTGKGLKNARKKGDPCTYVYPSGVTCNTMPATTVHVNTNHVDYHRFQSSKSATKSARASSLQQQLQTTAKPKADYCTFPMKANGGREEMCEAKPDDPIHDQSFGYAGYHEFQPPQQAAATGD